MNGKAKSEKGVSSTIDTNEWKKNNDFEWMEKLKIKKDWCSTIDINEWIKDNDFEWMEKLKIKKDWCSTIYTMNCKIITTSNEWKS